MKKMLSGFKDFIARGNAIDLAVGVVIGGAFAAVAAAIGTGLLSPLIGFFLGQTDLTTFLDFHLWNAHFQLGLILDAALKFLITAAAVYFVIVLPLNKLAERRKAGIVDEPAAPAEDILLLQEIRDLLAGQSSPALRNDTGPAAPPQRPTDL